MSDEVIGHPDDIAVPQAGELVSAGAEPPSVMDDLAIEVSTLQEAETVILHLTRFDLVIRLLLGKIYTQIERKQLFAEKGYTSLRDYLEYEEPAKETADSILAAMYYYQVFIESLGLRPEDLKAQRVSLSALKLISRYVRTTRRDERGFLIVENEAQVRRYLTYAVEGRLSRTELERRIKDELDPDRARSLFRIMSEERVGSYILVTFEEERAGERIQMGTLRVTPGGLGLLKSALRRSDLLSTQLAAPADRLALVAGSS